METVRKVLAVSAAVVGALFSLAALVAAMTAAPILAAAVVLGLLASVFLMNDAQQAEFLAFVRLMCGEPTAPRLREQSPYAAVRRAGGVDRSFKPPKSDAVGRVVVRPVSGGGSHNATEGHTDKPEPKLSPYEARAEGDEKHDAPPLELRELPLN